MYYNRSQFTIDVFVLKYEHTGWNFFWHIYAQSPAVENRDWNSCWCVEQINGENVLGVTHEKAVSLLTSRPDITIVVQRDVVSPSSSPDRSSYSSASPRHVMPERPKSPTRPGISVAPAGKLYTIISSLTSDYFVVQPGVFLSLDRVTGTLCLSHYVTEISHLYSLRELLNTLWFV